MSYTDSGAFVPSPWKPLTKPMFDVVPPEQLDTPGHDTPLWYEKLLHTTALTLQYLVTSVDHNYKRSRDVKFGPFTLGHYMAYTEVISTVFLDGVPTANQVRQELNRLSKTVGLVVYSPEPGRRHNRPMAARTIDIDEATTIVDAAFHGRYDAVGTQ